MADWRRYFVGKRVWVTGASSGIGNEIVRALGAAGVNTIASARRLERLEELASSFESVTALPLDIVDFGSIEEVTMRAWDQLGGIDILINNAGISHRFLFAEAEPASLQRVVDVNLNGTMYLTQAVLKRMLAAGGGHIATVTSYAIHVPTPHRTVYTAVKRALHGLFDALRTEVDDKGITITLAVPGMVRTEIGHHAVTAGGGEHGKLDSILAEGMTAEDCAERILRGVAARRREFAVAVVPKLLLGRFLHHNMPGLFYILLKKFRVV
jgi:short-subunit dehydrogenase